MTKPVCIPKADESTWPSARVSTKTWIILRGLLDTPFQLAGHFRPIEVQLIELIMLLWKLVLMMRLRMGSVRRRFETAQPFTLILRLYALVLTTTSKSMDTWNRVTKIECSGQGWPHRDPMSGWLVQVWCFTYSCGKYLRENSYKHQCSEKYASTTWQCGTSRYWRYSGFIPTEDYWASDNSENVWLQKCRLLLSVPGQTENLDEWGKL